MGTYNSCVAAGKETEGMALGRLGAVRISLSVIELWAGGRIMEEEMTAAVVTVTTAAVSVMDEFTWAATKWAWRKARTAERRARATRIVAVGGFAEGGEAGWPRLASRPGAESRIGQSGQVNASWVYLYGLLAADRQGGSA